MGVSIQKGEGVFTIIPSANRDDYAFEKPENFDICRKKNEKKERPSFCNEKNISLIQKEECLAFDEAALKEKLPKAPKYPVRFHGWKVNNQTNEAIEIDWAVSSEKLNLEITTPHICGALGCAKRGKPITTIPLERIISYEQSIYDNTDNSAELATNVGITAVLFPLGALFQGVNYKKIEIYRWSIDYVNEYGVTSNETFFTTSEVPVADRYYTFLSDITGLQNKRSKSEESLRGFYLDGISKFEKKLEKDFKNLSISDTSNTCSVLNTEKYPLSTSIFLEEKKQFDSLREKFDLEPHVLEGYCE